MSRRLVAIAFGITLLSFWLTWATLPPLWNDYLGHGWMIFGFILWRAWSERAQFVPLARPDYSLLLPMGVLSVVWMFASAIQVQAVHQLAAPTVLLLWLMTVLGRPIWRVAAPIVATFLLALPVWMIVVPVLQVITVYANRVFLQFAPFSAQFDGSTITIPGGTFEVAGSCAGQAFLLSAVTIAVMHLQLIPMSRRAGLLAVGWAALLALVMNWIRVFLLILIGYFSRMQSPLIADHGWFGWVLFLFVIGGFLWGARRLERSDAYAPKSETTVSTATPSAVPVSALLLAAFVAVSGPVLLLAVRRLPMSPAPQRAVGIAAGSGWQFVRTESLPVFAESPSAQRATRSWQPLFVGAREHRVEYWQSGVSMVRVDRLIYGRQQQGQELVNELNRIAAPDALLDQRSVGPLDASFRVVQQAVVRGPAEVRVVWYWYSVAGIETALAQKAKLLELIALGFRRVPSELVSASTVCEDAGCRAGVDRLQAFVSGRAGNQPSPRGS